MTGIPVSWCNDEQASGFPSSPRGPLVRMLHTRVPGRARLKVAMLYRSELVKHRLEAGLSDIAGITSVKGNVLTGNLLVVFAQNRSADEIAVLVLERLGTDASPAALRRPRPLEERRCGPGNAQTIVHLHAPPLGFAGPTGLYYVPLSFLGSFTVGLLQMSPILTFLTLSVILMGQIVGKKEGWSRGDALYFSFVTATTVGYGDLRPTKTSSKALAVGISFVGLVFTGIVAAIGLHSAQHAFESTQRLATL